MQIENENIFVCMNKYSRKKNHLNLFFDVPKFIDIVNLEDNIDLKVSRYLSITSCYESIAPQQFIFFSSE